MQRPCFELRDTDGAGRLGRLEIPRRDVTVETPAMLPVVNPHVQVLDPSELADTFGAEIIITNAYVFHQSDDVREPALTAGLHDVLDFPGAIMTDSGSFQLAEYGEIDVDTEEILAFQDAIGSDIATPVDVPTPPDADRETAEADLAETQAAIETAAAYDGGDMLVTAPVQGGAYPDLRTEAARKAATTDCDIYPIGAVVPLMRAYRFDELVSIADAAHQGLPNDVPVHLFGAGHPMMFSIGVLLGCDLFDSAAYALYARDGRYLTVTGTEHLEDLSQFPCSCPVCVEHTPAELRDAEAAARERALAAHNLHVTFGELRRVRQAVRSGELLELVEIRARSHPRLLDGYREVLANSARLREHDPASKPRPFFAVSSDSASRPEVSRHHDRLGRITVPSSLTLIDSALLPDRLSPWDDVDTSELPEPVAAAMTGSWWPLLPPFGPVPQALTETYPLTAEVPRSRDVPTLLAAAQGVGELTASADPTLTIVHDGWPSVARDALPRGSTVIDASAHSAVEGIDD